MIDLTKPIRRKETHAPARVLATDVGGDRPICISYHVFGSQWETVLLSDYVVGMSFENFPPEPATGVVYVWWKDGMVFGATAYPHDAQVWRDRGGAVSEHMVTEPQS